MFLIFDVWPTRRRFPISSCGFWFPGITHASLNNTEGLRVYIFSDILVCCSCVNIHDERKVHAAAIHSIAAKLDLLYEVAKRQGVSHQTGFSLILSWMIYSPGQTFQWFGLICSIANMLQHSEY